MADKFDLRKYLIENEVTTSSKLLKELEIEIDPEQPTGRRFVDVLEIETASFGRTHRAEVKRDFQSKNFETYCNKQAAAIKQEHTTHYIEDLQADLDNDDEGPTDWESIADTYQKEMGIGEPVFNPTKTACEIAVDEDILLYILDIRKIDVTPEELEILKSITKRTESDGYYPILDKLMAGVIYSPPDWLI